MVEVYFEKGNYGIKENGLLVVPLVYYDAVSAIEEWEYFERLNSDKSQFLNHKRTHEEISEIVNQLKNNNT